ncbi:seminal metalloprotease 1-like [Eurosta solidaginis]|uniref:seminal metalloprotease 1-like n=1 Tax=Eurosta solidaginis TaxID=178769 RepID=UPI003530602B
MIVPYTSILLSVFISSLAAPLSTKFSEDDPELTAGYFEGDMVIDDTDRNGLKQETRRWPNNIVYYKINDNFFDESHRNHILRGMQILEEVSCIRFQEASEDQQYYVNITGLSNGCYSSVGWLNRVQTYNIRVYPLDSGCFHLGVIVHELLHTLGFYHMQNAANRDDYVRIATENIRPGKEMFFKKYDENSVDDFDEEYDYGSVLHYKATAFSVNGNMTIIPLKQEALGIMGQRRGMSKSDINKLNTMYRCPINL